MQATHDVFFHGRDVAAYDHLAFPGVVPRTFLGAIALATAAAHGAAAARALGLPKIFVQLVVRAILAVGTCFGLWRVLSATEARFGRPAALASTLLLCATPHTLFYASRTLPNTFALCLVAHAVAEWLRADSQPGPVQAQDSTRNVPIRHRGNLLWWGWFWGDDVAPFGVGQGERLFPPAHASRALSLLASAALWFRCDVVVLAGPIVLSMLAHRKVTLPQAALLGCVVAPILLIFTVLVDSVVWRRWLWPEGEVLFFNTVANRSSEYGVSPWHWYATSALPRLLLGGVFFLPVGLLRFGPASASAAAGKNIGYLSFFPSVQHFCGLSPELDSGVLEYGAPAFVFVALYSFLPHKETRFLLPSMPLVFLVSGCGFAKVFSASLAVFLAPPQPSVRDSAGSVAIAPVQIAFSFRKTSYHFQFLERITVSRVFIIIFGFYILFSTVLSIAGTGIYLRVSRDNYPGGAALQRVYSLLSRDMHASENLIVQPILSILQGGGAHFCITGDVTATQAAEWARQCLYDESSCFSSASSSYSTISYSARIEACSSAHGKECFSARPIRIQGCARATLTSVSGSQAGTPA